MVHRFGFYLRESARRRRDVATTRLPKKADGATTVDEHEKKKQNEIKDVLGESGLGPLGNAATTWYV